MSYLIEGLKSLYKNGKITIEKINDLLKDGKISQDEYMYILN